MISKNIVDYIKSQIDKGQSKDVIRGALSSAGWQMTDIEEAFRYAEQDIPSAPMPINPSYSYHAGQNNQGASVLSSPTDLLKHAWGIYKVRYKTFFGIILAQAIPVFIMVIIAFIYAVSSSFTAVSGPAMNIVNFVLAILTIILIPFMIIAIFWSQASLLFAVKDSEENIGVKESYRRGWHKIGSIFWAGLLSGIIILGGYFLLVIPGIIFGTWFSLATMIVVAESLGGMNAILKSKSYVSGYWWDVFWRMLFISLVLVGINLIFGIPAGIINFVAGLLKSNVLAALGGIINFTGNIVSFLLTPLTVIYTFLVYKNIKAIKGEVKSEFSSGEKIKYIIAGLLGIILVFGFIIGLVILVSLNSARGKAMDASRQASIQSLQGPLMLYADDHNGMYPASLQQLVIEKENYSNSIYTQILPTDPKTKLPYEYRQLKGGKDFEICANFDIGGRKCINKPF